MVTVSKDFNLDAACIHINAPTATDASIGSSTRTVVDGVLTTGTGINATRVRGKARVLGRKVDTAPCFVDSGAGR